MAPGVIGQQRVMVGELVLGRKEQAVVLGVGAVVGLLDLGVVLSQGGVDQIGQAARWLVFAVVAPATGE